MRNKPTDWTDLFPRFQKMVLRLGTADVAARMYGDSGGAAIQAGRTSVYYWFHKQRVPRVFHMQAIERAVEAWEAEIPDRNTAACDRDAAPR